jgi:hypothetical protein
LPEVSETLYFSSSPIKGNHKTTDQANGMAKKCLHSGKLFDIQTQPLKCSLTAEQRVLSILLVGTKEWQGECHDGVTLETRTHSSYSHIGHQMPQQPHCQFHLQNSKDQ